MSHTHSSKKFRSLVFDRPTLEKGLSKAFFQRYCHVLDGTARLDLELADAIALKLKEWALEKGATHYTHWFQPFTGAGAEKHDAFYSWTRDWDLVEKFSGKDLLKGEPDASSFPSGGLRATHQARGYTSWDPAISPFLWRGGGGVTLCIPALFFSHTGEALDWKIPLLRSEEKLERSVLRLLKLCGIKATRAFSTLGPEQEYFAIDRKWLSLRPDLLLAGRTVYGTRSVKGQELEDHYFGTVREKILSYMRDVEEAAWELGIPVKTRHNEVAPSQFEVAPLFEPSSYAIDHNLMLMELFRQKAPSHNLACLLHEKPFAGINGSGKHNNWSVATDQGLNLLDPKGHSHLFLIFLTAILSAVHRHAGALRASIASAGNDHRLGGSEAPPTILSVYLGEALEEMIHHFVQNKEHSTRALAKLDLRLSRLSPFDAEEADRNRTSFFAFTGNKFEFRAVGSSAHCALPVTMINAIVADSLHLILDEIDDALKNSKDLSKIEPVLRKHLKAAQPVLFSGNGYSVEWEREASRRKLPNIRKSFHAFAELLDKKTLRAFEEILSEEEMEARFEIFVEHYVKVMQIEVNLMLELFQNQILPAAIQDQRNRLEALTGLKKKSKPQEKKVEELATCIDEAIETVDALKVAKSKIEGLGFEAKGKVYCEILGPKMEKAREKVDALERLVDARLWPLPKYREMLFSP